jgi:hypothetical protein
MSEEQKKSELRDRWEELLGKLPLRDLATIALAVSKPAPESDQTHVHGVSARMLDAIAAVDKEKEDRIKELETVVAKQKEENEMLRAFIVNELGGFPDGAPAKKQKQ